jgi:hypothetical protein
MATLVERPPLWIAVTRFDVWKKADHAFQVRGSYFLVGSMAPFARQFDLPCCPDKKLNFA